MTPTKNATPATAIWDQSVKHLFPARIDRFVTGFQFTEGPVWHPEGYLLFSDTPANKIIKALPDGSTTPFLSNSGGPNEQDNCLSDMIGSNGLAIGANNRLYICQHGNHGIAALQDGELVPIVNSYDHRPFNSPNDLVIDRHNKVYFSDPPYGLKDQVLNPALFQSCAGVYCFDGKNAARLPIDLNYPNGLCLSPAQDILYISTNHPDEPKLLRCLLDESGDLVSHDVLVDQNADGIKCRRDGTLFMATDRGIMLISPEGKRLALIEIPEMPTNLAWQGDTQDIFYVTARTSVYKVTLASHQLLTAG